MHARMPAGAARWKRRTHGSIAQGGSRLAAARRPLAVLRPLLALLLAELKSQGQAAKEAHGAASASTQAAPLTPLSASARPAPLLRRGAAPGGAGSAKQRTSWASSQAPCSGSAPILGAPQASRADFAGSADATLGPGRG